MKLLDLKDPRWDQYKTGYNLYERNVTEWIEVLLSGDFPESHWDFLWDELHHQNDVGEASYAVVPYLAKYAKEQKDYSWHVFAFPVVVELARLDVKNPNIPPEIESSYFWSFQELAKIAVELESWSEEQTAVMSACIALAKGQRIFARAYLELSSKETAKEFLLNEMGWEPGESDL